MRSTVLAKMWRLVGCSKSVWHAIGKSWPFGRKIYFDQKNLKKHQKVMDNFSDRLTLEGAGDQTGDTWWTFSLGYNRSN